MGNLDFSIKEGIKPIDECTEEEAENMPASAGFWYSLGSGDCNMFIELLKDEETKKKCYEAVSILSKLESVTDDYIIWM